MGKCEYRHAPPSKYERDGDNYLNMDGAIDDMCSDRGVVDKKRGICKCNGVPTPFWGVAPNPVQVNGACETRKCPNSNGINYPFVSGNACNGHGACIPESGACVCEQPYFGLSCESTNCPNDCSGKGQCNTNTGKCACSQDPIKYSGPSCEFMDCPAGCNAPAGECNRNNGKCICKMGTPARNASSLHAARPVRSIHQRPTGGPSGISRDGSHAPRDSCCMRSSVVLAAHSPASTLAAALLAARATRTFIRFDTATTTLAGITLSTWLAGPNACQTISCSVCIVHASRSTAYRWQSAALSRKHDGHSAATPSGPAQ